LESRSRSSEARLFPPPDDVDGLRGLTSRVAAGAHVRSLLRTTGAARR
jgi:hypothetical protein